MFFPSNACTEISINPDYIEDLEPRYKTYSEGKVVLNEPLHCWLTHGNSAYLYWDVTIFLSDGYKETLWNTNIKAIGICSKIENNTRVFGIGVPSMNVIPVKNMEEANAIMEDIKALISEIY